MKEANEKLGQLHVFQTPRTQHFLPINRPLYYTTFFIRKMFLRKWASRNEKFKKMLKKSPVSNAWAAILKNSGFT